MKILKLKEALLKGLVVPTDLYKDASSLPFVKKAIDTMPLDYAKILGYCTINEKGKTWVSKMLFTLWTGRKEDDPTRTET